MVELAVVLGLGHGHGDRSPSPADSCDDARGEGATRDLSARLYDIRMEAISRSTEVALRFTPTNAGYIMTAYVDGNGNGVLARDIDRNIDRQLHSPEQLSVPFSGVDFGTLPGCRRSRRGHGPRRRPDPVRREQHGELQRPRHLIVRDPMREEPRRRADAIRVVGATARVRIFRFDSRSNNGGSYECRRLRTAADEAPAVGRRARDRRRHEQSGDRRVRRERLGGGALLETGYRLLRDVIDVYARDTRPWSAPRSSMRGGPRGA